MMTVLDNKLRELLESNEWTPEQREWLLQYLETTDSAELQHLVLEYLHQQVTEPEQRETDRDYRDLDVIHARIGV